MPETLAPGEVREVVSDADPRGDYRLTVQKGSVAFGKTKQEVKRGYSETVEKYNRVRFTLGEESESVWVRNTGERRAKFDIVKSGFFAEFFPSQTQETTTEQAERRENVDEYTRSITIGANGMEFSGSANGALVCDIDDAYANLYPDAEGIVLTGILARAETSMAEPEQINLQTHWVDGSGSEQWEYVTRVNDQSSLPNGSRPFAPFGEGYKVEIDMESFALETTTVRFTLLFKVVE